MSHIILADNFEEVLKKLEDFEVFKNENEAAILISVGEHTLPLIFAGLKNGGVVMKAANGSQHLDQEPIQEEMAKLIKACGFRIERGVLSRKILRKYGLLNS